MLLAMLGVIIECIPHPAVAHIGPAARAANNTTENLVVCIVAAPTCDPFFKNYRPKVGDKSSRIESRILRILIVQNIARAIGVLDSVGRVGSLAHSFSGALIVARRCILGNIFADFTWEVLTLASAMQLSFVLLEQPEDLGAMAYGPHAGERPASMWQWPAFAEITAKPDWKTFAFHQGNFGAGYPKPTRLLVFAKECFKLPSFCYEGRPSFDDKGFYLGPLPMAKGMGSIRNRQSKGPFKTSGTEMWPAKMCQWISFMLLSSWASSATTASKGVPDTQRRTRPLARRQRS